MLLIPSIDLRGGHCVRLLKGEFDAETRYDIDPAELLALYADAGVRWLHLVDLDGARDGTPGNRDLIRRMAGQSRIRIQLGGGLRNRALVLVEPAEHGHLLGTNEGEVSVFVVIDFGGHRKGSEVPGSRSRV